MSGWNFDKWDINRWDNVVVQPTRKTQTLTDSIKLKSALITNITKITVTPVKITKNRKNKH